MLLPCEATIEVGATQLVASQLVVQHTCDHVVLRALPVLDATEKQNRVIYGKFLYTHTHQVTQTSGRFIPQVSCRSH